MGAGPTLGWGVLHSARERQSKNVCRVCVGPRAHRIGTPSSVPGPLGCMTEKLTCNRRGGCWGGADLGVGCAVWRPRKKIKKRVPGLLGAARASDRVP